MRNAVLLVMVAAGCGVPPAKSTTTAAAPSTAAGARSETARPYKTLSSDSVPRFFPNFVAACPTDRIDVIMRDHFNPALTQMADAIFRGEREDRLEEVAEAAGAVLGCAKTITTHRHSKITEDQWPIFDHFMIQLVMNTQALQTAALEDELDDVKHWFHHVKQSCAGCHSRFNSR